jgi:hypothetical protein
VTAQPSFRCREAETGARPGADPARPLHELRRVADEDTPVELVAPARLYGGETVGDVGLGP